MTVRDGTVSLLPCPFCGNAPLSIEKWIGKHEGWQIFCHHQDCDVAVGVEELSEAEAIAAWNRRSVPSEPVACDQELAAARKQCRVYIDHFDDAHRRAITAEAICQSLAETAEELACKYKADAADAMATYNQEVEAHAKLEASLIRLSDNDRQLLRMIAPFVDQRSREPGDAWNEAAAILWLLIDTSDPVAAFRPSPATKPEVTPAMVEGIENILANYIWAPGTVRKATSQILETLEVAP